MASKTKSWGGLILGGLMLALAGFLVGGYGGSQLTATFLLDKALKKDARDMRSQIQALQHIRNGKIADAIELLESQLDQDLILFDPQTPYAGLSEQTEEAVSNVILQAKTYRQGQPRQSSSSFTNEAVRQLFEKSTEGEPDKTTGMKSAASPAVKGYIACKNPRLEICTMEYIPVCATLGNAQNKTYASACTACSNIQVAGHVPGDCKPVVQ